MALYIYLLYCRVCGACNVARYTTDRMLGHHISKHTHTGQTAAPPPILYHDILHNTAYRTRIRNGGGWWCEVNVVLHIFIFTLLNVLYVYIHIHTIYDVRACGSGGVQYCVVVHHMLHCTHAARYPNEQHHSHTDTKHDARTHTLTLSGSIYALNVWDALAFTSSHVYKVQCSYFSVSIPFAQFENKKKE